MPQVAGETLTRNATRFAGTNQVVACKTKRRSKLVGRWERTRRADVYRLAFGMKMLRTTLPRPLEIVAINIRTIPQRKFDDTVERDFGDIDDNDFENTDRNNHRQQVPLQTPNTAMKRKIMMSLKEAQNSDFYKLLGITKNASPTEIKRAYHKLSFAYHPDKAGRGGNCDGVEITSPEDTTAMFTLIAKAHEVLSDPVERATYDMVEGFQKSTGKT